MKHTQFLNTTQSPLGSFEKKTKNKKPSPLNLVSCQLVFNNNINSNFINNGFVKSDILDPLKHSFQCSSKSFSGHFIVLSFFNLPSFETSEIITSIGSLINFKLTIHQFLAYRYPVIDSELFNYKIFFSFTNKFNLENPSMFLFKGFVPNISLFSTETHAIIYSLQNPLNNELIDPSSVEIISPFFCSNIKPNDLQSLISSKT